MKEEGREAKEDAEAQGVEQEGMEAARARVAEAVAPEEETG